MSLFKGKTLMITGGTGSFGNAVLNRFLDTDIGEIRVLSRDEKKQDDMRHEFQAKMPEVAEKIKFFIGDVRDLASVKNAMHGVDYIFHAAALKQVPSCEFFPIEAVKTNVLGTDNVLTAAIEAGVECVICLSTDKAAYPINAMGITKAVEDGNKSQKDALAEIIALLESGAIAGGGSGSGSGDEGDEGEGGEDEWVVPESKMASLISQINAGLDQQTETAGAGRSITVNMYNNIASGLDADEIGQRMLTSIRRTTL